jgi:hypothetical protein
MAFLVLGWCIGPAPPRGRVEHASRYWKGTLFVYFKEENRVSQLRLSFHSSRFQIFFKLKKKPISSKKTKSSGCKIQPTLLHSRTSIGYAVGG